MFFVPAEFGRTDAAHFALQPTEAHDGADTHAKLLRNFRDCATILRRPNYAITQILRIWLSHPILASVPVGFLNLIRRRCEIRFDSVFSGNALVWKMIASTSSRSFAHTDSGEPMIDANCL